MLDVFPLCCCTQAALARQQALLAADEAEDESELEADEDDDDDDDDESEDEAALQKGIASLKKTLAGAPLNGKIFDMRDDDEEVCQLAFVPSKHCSTPVLSAATKLQLRASMAPVDSTPTSQGGWTPDGTPDGWQVRHSHPNRTAHLILSCWVCAEQRELKAN